MSEKLRSNATTGLNIDATISRKTDKNLMCVELGLG